MHRAGRVRRAANGPTKLTEKLSMFPLSHVRSRSFPHPAVVGGVFLSWLLVVACVSSAPAQSSAVPAAAVPMTADVPVAPSQAVRDEPSLGAPTTSADASPPSLDDPTRFIRQWMEPGSLPTTVKTVAVITLFSLVPAVVLMTTSFIRISIVLGLLRQALGTSMLPSNQIMTMLSMFLTVLIMMPVWTQVYQEAIVPFSRQDAPRPAAELLQCGLGPISEFMGRQIERAGNAADVWLFYDYLGQSGAEPQTYGDVPLPALLPAFVLSELKVAFLIGFQIYLPFLIIDLVVASVSTSLGMMMLPPTMISLPLKLVMFVLVDGWHLVVQMLLESFGGPIG